MGEVVALICMCSIKLLRVKTKTKGKDDNPVLKNLNEDNLRVC